MRNQEKKYVEIEDKDIATIEALHDLLLDNHAYSKDHYALKRSRKLTKKMYDMFESNKLEFKIPEGYELDKENSTDEILIYKKNKYPMSWYEFENKNRLFIPDWIYFNRIPKKYIALAKLECLRDAWNEINGFKADFENPCQDKHCVKLFSEKINISTHIRLFNFLHFESRETANLFLKTFKDLIEEAKELL